MPRRSERRFFFSGLYVILLWVITAGSTACDFHRDSGVPRELIGVWETSSDAYKSCSFELKDGMIIFINNDLGLIDQNHIKKIESSSEGSRLIYKIRYTNKEDNYYTLSLYYIKQGEEAIIKYKNQLDVEWRKRKDALSF